MPNTPNSSGTQTPNSNRRRDPSQDSGREWRGKRNEEQDDAIGDRDDNVEVGDPVPEKERTIRASHGGQGLSTGQGETGEDEGLSGDVGDDGRH